MSYQRPIFNAGLYGKANASVMNGFVDSAEAVFANEEGLRWAQRQVVQGDLQLTFLAKLTSATLLAPNRWEYAFEPYTYSSSATGRLPVALTTTTWGASTTDPKTKAINIRETRNLSANIDGSPLPTGASIGPVGSSWATGWPTSGLEGYVWMHAEYDQDGGILHWFDAPNPIKC